MKPLLKRFGLGAAALTVLLLFLAWDIFKFVAFLLGLAAVPDDFATTKTVVGKMLDWLLATPWWVPSSLLLIPLGVLVYLVWKSADDFTISKAYREQASMAAQFVADARALNELRGKGETLRKAAEQFIAVRERCEAWNAGDLEGENKLRFEGRVQRETGEAWQSALIAMTGAIADMIDNHDSPPHINLDRAVPGEREDPNKKFLFRKMTHEHDQILDRYSTAVQRYGTNFNWLSKSTASIAEPLSLPSIVAKMRL